VQLLVLMGEVAVITAAVLGFAMIGRWVLDADVRLTSRQPRPPTELICWHDRRYGEMCAPDRRPPNAPYDTPMRRHYVAE
jgi:hypothetical protein